MWYGAGASVAFAILFGVSGVGWIAALAVALAILLLCLAGVSAVRLATGEWPAQKSTPAE